MPSTEYVEVGYVLKTYGLQGALRIRLLDHLINSFPQIETIFIKDQGQFIPYFIGDIVEQNNPVIKLEDINKPEEAKTFTKRKVYVLEVDAKLFSLKEGQADYLALASYAVYNEKNRLGTIGRLEAFPQQLMAIIIYQGDELMIPLVPEFIKDINHESREIFMSLPDGLLSL